MPTDRKITDHTTLTGAGTATGDLIEIVDINVTTDGATGTNKKQTMAEHILAIKALGFAAGAAYTQTYSTADRTHANPTAATLTVADGAGTNDNTIGAITDNASTIAAVQEIVDEINKLVADVADVKQLLNAVIDDLQSWGVAT